MPDLRCHEDVTRNDESQPCDRLAVGWRYDPEGDHHYPVCSEHTWGDTVSFPVNTDIAAVAKAIRDADGAHYVVSTDVGVVVLHAALRCFCNTYVSVVDFDAHRYDAMARAAADALGVSL